MQTESSDKAKRGHTGAGRKFTQQMMVFPLGQGATHGHAPPPRADARLDESLQEFKTIFSPAGGSHHQRPAVRGLLDLLENLPLRSVCADVNPNSIDDVTTE